MTNLKEKRELSGLSKLGLSHGSGVSRYRITLNERYGVPLAPEEERAISECLLATAQRYASIASWIRNEVKPS